MPADPPTLLMTDAQRARMAAEIVHRPWAVHEETLKVIADVLRRPMSAQEIQERVGPQAATRGQRRAGAVAVISLRGVITPRGSFWSSLFGDRPGGLLGFQALFNEAMGDQDVAALVLDIDSPGGLCDLVPETAAMIRAARDEKPIVAVANTMAASAAYHLAAQASEVVVTPSGQVGSIGVFLLHEDWSKFNADFGVLPTYISAGKYKTDGNPDEPLSDSAREHFQATVDEFYGLFVADVAAGRRASAQAVRDGYGEGRTVLAKQAVALGMADRVETLEETIGRLLTDGPLPTGRKAAAPSPAPPRAETDPPDPEPDPAPEPAPETDPEPEPEPEPDPEPAEDEVAESAAARRRTGGLMADLTAR